MAATASDGRHQGSWRDRVFVRDVAKALAFAALGFVLHDAVYGGTVFATAPAALQQHQSTPHQQVSKAELHQQQQKLLDKEDQLLAMLHEHQQVMKTELQAVPAASTVPFPAAATPSSQAFQSNVESPSTGDCHPAADAQLRDAVRAAVVERRTYPVSGGPPFTHTAAMHIHPCVRSLSRQLSVRKDVLFIVMAGSVLKNRVRAMWDTWGRGMQNTGNVLIMSDADDPELHMMTLPELQGRTAKEEGSHRSLRGLQYAMSQPRYANFSWIALVDDDAWVNVREIPAFLYGWNPAAPLMFAFFWNSPWFKRESSWPSGPFMLLSRSAAETMAPRLYTPDCPFDNINDITLGACSWRSGVALVHTPLVDPEGVHFLTDKTYMKMSDNGALPVGTGMREGDSMLRLLLAGPERVTLHLL